MFKINVTLVALIALALGAFVSPAAFAGGGGPGPVGDGIGIQRDSLSVIDPLRDGNFVYNLFGETGDTLFVADWDGDGTPSFGVARVDNGALLWILDTAGNGSLDYLLFGSEGDTPVVGDFDSASPGVEVGFVRAYPGAGQLEWIVQDSGGTGFTRTFFGADTDTPAPGNWDGDAGNGDELGLVRADGGALLWITQGSGGLDYNLFGASGDEPLAGDWDGDGNTDLGVRAGSGDGNVFVLDGTSLEYVQLGAPSDAPLNSGSFGQP